jgi:hypothetical protein
MSQSHEHVLRTPSELRQHFDPDWIKANLTAPPLPLPWSNKRKAPEISQAISDQLSTPDGVPHSKCHIVDDKSPILPSQQWKDAKVDGLSVKSETEVCFPDMFI